MPWISGAIVGGLGLVGDIWSSSEGTSAAKAANKANIQIARENREWSEKMSDSAVQRRVADIQKAGGNPALAFTGGQSASTPSASIATVEPTFRPEWTKGSLGTAALAGLQRDQIKANTQNVSADTRLKTANARILEEFGPAQSAADLEARTSQNKKLIHEIDRAAAEADISKQTAELLRQKTPDILALLSAQAKIGKLNADSSEAIAQTLGVAGKDVGTVGKLFLEIAKLLFLSNTK